MLIIPWYQWLSSAYGYGNVLHELIVAHSVLIFTAYSAGIFECFQPTVQVLYSVRCFQPTVQVLQSVYKLIQPTMLACVKVY